MKTKFLSLLTILLLLISIKFEGDSDWRIRTKRKNASAINERISSVILHYTALDNERSIRALTKGPVSSHYLITDIPDDPIYNLVDEKERAWHAGESVFFGRKNINDTSLGIEIVNLGYLGPRNKPSQEEISKYGTNPVFLKRNFSKFDEIQIEKAVFLLKKIIQRYGVNPTFILGHSDVSPGRKIDPGPNFPWKYLYDQYNIGAWYEEKDKKDFMERDAIVFKELTIPEIKDEFRKYGYEIPDTEEWDPKSSQVVYSFQMHFRPEHVDGIVDLETYSILKALNKKYR